MREHKYRFWHKKEKIFLYLSLEEIYKATEKHLFVPFAAWDDLIPCMDTLRKDKNGIKIYEGDILPYEANYVFKGVKKSLYGIVTWSQENLCFYLSVSDGKQILAKGLHASSCEFNEVVGNIYENPELLENKNESEG